MLRPCSHSGRERAGGRHEYDNNRQKRESREEEEEEEKEKGGEDFLIIFMRGRNGQGLNFYCDEGGRRV